MDTAIDIAKKALEEGNCCVIGLQSTGEARSKGAAATAGKNNLWSSLAFLVSKTTHMCHFFFFSCLTGIGDSGGEFEDFVSAPNEDLKRIIMMMFPLPPKPHGVIAPGEESLFDVHPVKCNRRVILHYLLLCLNLISLDILMVTCPFRCS